MALLDHLADMDRFLGLYSNEKPIRVCRSPSTAGSTDEVFLWYPNTTYTPANPGSADANFISEVKSILDQLWAADPQPSVPITWTTAYAVGNNRMAITVTHREVTNGRPTTSSVLQDTVLDNGLRGLRFLIYAGTVKAALEYYRNHASPLLEITWVASALRSMSTSSAMIQVNPFEAFHVFSAATAQKNISGVSILAHELCHCFLKATMETSVAVALNMIKEIDSNEKPSNQPITDYRDHLEHDIVMNYYELPVARAFGQGERAEYSFNVRDDGVDFLAAIYMQGGLPGVTQLNRCKIDVVYQASDSSGATCTEMAPAPDNSMLLTNWANQIVLDWISGALVYVPAASSQPRGLYRNGVLIYAP